LSISNPELYIPAWQWDAQCDDGLGFLGNNSQLDLWRLLQVSQLHCILHNSDPRPHSNALTLEQVTSEHPRTGTLITFLQFLLISIHGLFTHVTFSSPQASSGLRRLPYPRLKPRKLPIKWYFVQVFLFYAVNLLNNTAFRYGIPMTVHIIFRSAGLLVSMLLGWAFAEKT
jgi:hypothetical protein